MKRVLLIVLAVLMMAIPLSGCSNEAEELKKRIAEYRAQKFSAYEEENARYADFEVDVAFLGDSLTDGYDLKTYYPQYLVSNRGIGGETTVGLEERMKLSLYDLCPKVAVMLIGANNIDTMLENYEDLLIGFQKNVPQTKIILLSLTSMSGEWGKKNELARYNNIRIKLLAEEYGYAFVDLYTALMDPETEEIRPEYTTDGGHLTGRGYEVLTREITPVIDAQLAAWKAEH